MLLMFELPFMVMSNIYKKFWDSLIPLRSFKVNWIMRTKDVIMYWVYLQPVLRSMMNW